MIFTKNKNKISIIAYTENKVQHKSIKVLYPDSLDGDSLRVLRKPF